MSKLNRVRLMTTAFAFTLLPGMLLAAPGDHERKKDRKKSLERRVERRVERSHRAQSRRSSSHTVSYRTPRVVECSEPVHQRRNGRTNRHCSCVEVIRPGYYKTVIEKVRTPGYYKRVWVPGRRLRFDDCRIEVGTRRGHYERRYVPGKIRKVERQVWVPAERVIEKRCHKHRGRGRGH